MKTRLIFPILLIFPVLIIILLSSSCMSERLVTKTVAVMQTVTQIQTSTITIPPTTVTINYSTTQQLEEYEVVKAIYKITEKNAVYWTFSWQATIKNNTPGRLELSVKVLFVDNDGFVLGNSVIRYIDIQQWGQETIKDYLFIGAEVANEVVAIELLIM